MTTTAKPKKTKEEIATDDKEIARRMPMRAATVVRAIEREIAQLIKRGPKAKQTTTQHGDEVAALRSARATAMATHATLLSCSTMFEGRRLSTSTTKKKAADEVAHDGTVRPTRRRAPCQHSLCLNCHGRAHRSRPVAAKVIDENKRHHQFAIQIERPYSRCSLVEAYEDATAKVQTLMGSPVWAAWAVGYSVSLELTPSSVADGLPHYHAHIVAQLADDADAGVPHDVLAVLGAMGEVAKRHSPVSEGTAQYFHDYSVKGHAGKGKASPLHGANNATLDGMVRLVGRPLHWWGGQWLAPSSATSSKTIAVKKTTAKKRTKVKTKADAVARRAASFRPPVAVVAEDEQEAVATLEIVQVDSVGRRRGQSYRDVVVSVVSIDALTSDVIAQLD